MAFGHNEIWRPKAANRVFMTSIVLWPSSTTNSGGLAAAKVATKLAKISPIGNADLRRIEEDDVPWHSLSDPTLRGLLW